MTDVQRPQSTPGAEEPLSELLRTATADLSTLFHQELELAKVEMKDDLRQAGKVGGMFGAGAVCGYLALLFASFALAWLLDDVMPRPLAFVLVGVVYTVVALLSRTLLRSRPGAARAVTLASGIIMVALGAVLLGEQLVPLLAGRA